MRKLFGPRPVAPLLALLLTLSACTGQIPALPPLASEGQFLPGKIVWHDLVTHDLDRAQRFYGDLFGWTFEAMGDDYLIARQAGLMVAGMARLGSASSGSLWLPLMSVSGIEQTDALVSNGGGERVLGPFVVPGRGNVAVFRDPQGALIGAINTGNADPADRPALSDRFFWNELWTDDIEGSLAFYAQVARATPGTRELPAGAYHYLAAGGTPRFGVLEKPAPEIDNTWVAYIRVADVTVTTERARNLGATVLMAPNLEVRGGRVAVLMDPNGAGFVIQEFQAGEIAP